MSSISSEEAKAPSKASRKVSRRRFVAYVAGVAAVGAAGALGWDYLSTRDLPNPKLSPSTTRGRPLRPRPRIR